MTKGPGASLRPGGGTFSRLSLGRLHTIDGGIAFRCRIRTEGDDWGADYYGHPSHLAWLSKYLKQHTAEFEMVDTCLDHITTGEDEKVPKNVAKVGLDELTWWCIRQVGDASEPGKFKDKTFRYPTGVVPLAD